MGPTFWTPEGHSILKKIGELGWQANMKTKKPTLYNFKPIKNLLGVVFSGKKDRDPKLILKGSLQKMAWRW